MKLRSSMPQRLMEDKMLVRTLLRCSAAAIFMLCFGLIACSDDTSRVVNPASTEPTVGLATGFDDSPTNSFDVYDYISQGFYDPDDNSNSDQQGYVGGGSHDNNNDNPSNKPIDNGRDADNGGGNSGFNGHDYGDDDQKKPKDLP